MGKIKAVLFDLDGTLVDSLGDIARALNTTLSRYQRVPKSIQELRPLVGWGLRSLLASAWDGTPSEGIFEEAYQSLLTEYRSRPVELTRAYPGMVDLVRDISSQTALGVLSNKEDSMTKAVVAAIFPNIPFRAVWGLRDGRAGKPNPGSIWEMLRPWNVEPGECVFVGDSDVDMQTAVAAGCVPVGVTWGFRSPGQLRQAGAVQLINSAQDLREWLKIPSRSSADLREELVHDS